MSVSPCIYTAAGDPDGTLGGLVRLGRPGGTATPVDDFTLSAGGGELTDPHAVTLRGVRWP